MFAYLNEESVDDMSKRVYNDEIVTNYVNRLIAAGRSKQEFDSVYAEMKSDKRVGAPEASAIAKKYGYRVAKTKKAAFDVVAKKFSDLVRTTALLEEAKKVRLL